jgi:hypothetical protein
VLLEDEPLDLLVTLGPVLQQLSNAVKSIPGVARSSPAGACGRAQA